MLVGWSLLVLGGLFALGLLGFRDATRGVLCLLGSMMAVAGLSTWASDAIVGALTLWMWGGAGGTLILVTLMLLNLRPDEIGNRRLQLQAGVVLVCIAYLAAVVVGVVGDDNPGPGRAHTQEGADLIGDALVGPDGVAFAVAGLTLLASMVAALLMVRRRS